MNVVFVKINLAHHNRATPPLGRHYLSTTVKVAGCYENVYHITPDQAEKTTAPIVNAKSLWRELSVLIRERKGTLYLSRSRSRPMIDALVKLRTFMLYGRGQRVTPNLKGWLRQRQAVNSPTLTARGSPARLRAGSHRTCSPGF